MNAPTDSDMASESTGADIFVILKSTINQIAKEAKTYQDKAKSEERYHKSFSSWLIFFSAAAPALVTFQTQAQNVGYKIAAVLLTVLAGTLGGLQATFRWGEVYRRTSITALALNELESNIRLELLEIEHKKDPVTIYKEAFALNSSAQRELQQIIRAHIEGEVALVTDQRDISRAKPALRIEGRAERRLGPRRRSAQAPTTATID